jgi:hypothetical protein
MRTTTKCPSCLSLWSGAMDEVSHYQSHCSSCQPRPVPRHEDTVRLDWIQRSPNPRLTLVVNAWVKCEGGVTLRGSIDHCIHSNPE